MSHGEPPTFNGTPLVKVKPPTAWPAVPATRIRIKDSTGSVLIIRSQDHETTRYVPDELIGICTATITTRTGQQHHLVFTDIDAAEAALDDLHHN